MNKYNFLFLSFAFLLLGCNNDLREFKACYPENKSKSLFNALLIIDEAMLNNYPATTLEKSYEMFAINYMSNPKESSEFVTTDQIDLLKVELSNFDLIDDLTILNSLNQRRRPIESDYFLCLKDLKSNGVASYIEESEAGGRLMYSVLIGNMTRLSELSKIEQFFIKVEFMIRIIEKRHLSLPSTP